MGHITTGGIVSEVRGSVGSLTYSRNSYGPYVKAKLVQSVKYTPKQLNRRQHFRDAVELWQSITQKERTLWNNWAKNFVKSSSLGVKTKRTGYSMFIEAYLNRSIVFTPPFYHSWEIRPKPRLFDPRSSIYGANFYLEFHSDDYVEAYYAVWFLSRQYTLGKQSINPSLLKFATAAEVAYNTDLVVNAPYQNLYGTPFVVDQDLCFFAGVRFIDAFSGIGSKMYIYRVQSVPDGFIS